MYQEYATLKKEHLKLKKSQCATLREWAFIQATKKSIKDDMKTYFVIVTYTSVAIVDYEPKFGNWYKVEGFKVSKFTPTFAVKV